jgi:hypothetical protein
MSDKLTIKGRITKILPLENGTSKSGKAWEKQSFVLDTGAQYNPECCFSMFGNEKVEMLNKFPEGSEVEVSFNISSRDFNGKYYHNLDCWLIKAVGSVSVDPNLNSSDSDDDLPY